MKNRTKCSCCDSEGSHEERMKKMREWEEEQVIKHGWFAHVVTDDDRTTTGMNIHTHVIKESFGHPDLQIVAVMNPEVAHHIICDIVKQIKDGIKFKSGNTYDGIIKPPFKVKFVKAVETDRNVLRVILPDKNGCLDVGKIGKPFDLQYADLLKGN